MKLLALAMLAAAAATWPLAAPAQDAAQPQAEPKAAEAVQDAPPQPAEAAQAVDPANEPDAPKAARQPGLSFGPGELPPGADPEAGDSLDLWAEQIVYESDTFTCTDNVVVTHGISRIECDKLVGTLGQVEKIDNATGEKTTEKAITELVATGSPLKMNSGERKAECLKAVYRLADSTITLTGDKDNVPTVTLDKGQVVYGEEIIFTIIGKDVRVQIKRGGAEVPVPKGKVPDLLNQDGGK